MNFLDRANNIYGVCAECGLSFNPKFEHQYFCKSCIDAAPQSCIKLSVLSAEAQASHAVKYFNKNKELIGSRFGRLVVLDIEPKQPNKRYSALCRCDCGVKRLIEIHKIKRGQNRSCGCGQGKKYD